MSDPTEKYPVFIIHTKGCFRQKQQTGKMSKAQTSQKQQKSQKQKPQQKKTIRNVHKKEKRKAGKRSMKEIVINENEAGQRLDKFLGKLLKEAPASFYYKMLRKKNIVLNGKKATGNEKLTAGDSIKLFLSDETFEKFAGKRQTNDLAASVPNIALEIVYEDHDVLAINKPAGMLSQKAKKEDISANEYILQYLLESGTITRESLHTFKPSVCNRLDRNTSGILVAGKTLNGLQQMSKAFRERSMEKYYLAIVAGHISKPRRIEGFLKKDEKNNQVTILSEPSNDAKPIITEYRPLKLVGQVTLLEVHPITGRSHRSVHT